MTQASSVLLPTVQTLRVATSRCPPPQICMKLLSPADHAAEGYLLAYTPKPPAG